jgi:protein-S-isoprenylcysteine O-methyltransferase Ste14
MTLTFAALRSALYAAGFLWLWAWVASLLRPYDDALGGPLPAWSLAVAFLALAFGGVVVAWCLGSFVVYGRGTPALFDAPRRFVARGPYRYVRNPMYIGAAFLLLGYGLYQQSPAIVLFVPVWWLLFHLLVILYEEPALGSKFGPDYAEYRRWTHRWIPRPTMHRL